MCTNEELQKTISKHSAKLDKINRSLNMIQENMTTLSGVVNRLIKEQEAYKRKQWIDDEAAIKVMIEVEQKIGSLSKKVSEQLQDMQKRLDDLQCLQCKHEERNK